MTSSSLLSAAAVLLVTACAGPNGHDPVTTDGTAIAVDSTALVADPAPDATVEDTVRDEAEEAVAQPTGGASLTIADRTWDFPDVVCLFGDDAAQVEAEFAMSGLANGYELYAGIGTEGHVITIDDVGDAADDAVSMTSVDSTPILRVDGRAITAVANFVPIDDPDATPTRGTLEADCGEPSPASTAATETTVE